MHLLLIFVEIDVESMSNLRSSTLALQVISGYIDCVLWLYLTLIGSNASWSSECAQLLDYWWMLQSWSNHFFIPALAAEINNNTLRIVWCGYGIVLGTKMCGKIILSTKRSCWQLYCIYSIVVGSLVSLEAVARVAFLCSRQQQPADQGY